jgi:hypothetical protein
MFPCSSGNDRREFIDDVQLRRTQRCPLRLVVYGPQNRHRCPDLEGPAMLSLHDGGVLK